MKTRKCKICKTPFEVKSNNHWCCDFDCAMELVEKQKEKKWKKEKAKRKKDLMTLQDWIKIAQTNFNKFINARDKGLPCISCQKPITGRVNASHYYNANNHWNVRFNEDNVNSSCITCNQHLSGNLIPYRGYLIEKIGIERFEHLESIAQVTRKFTIEEVKDINELYKTKIKEL